jgi:hypothetical protein
MMMMTITTMIQSTGPKTNAAVVAAGVSVGVGVGFAVGTGVGFAVGTGVGFGDAVGTGVGVGVDEVEVEVTVTETALEAGDVTGVEALSVTLQVTVCEVPAAV